MYAIRVNPSIYTGVSDISISLELMSFWMNFKQLFVCSMKVTHDSNCILTLANRRESKNLEQIEKKG